MTRLIKIEARLLGAYMHNQDAFVNCQHLVSATIFTNGVYRESYKIIKKLWAANIQPDIQILFAAVKKLGYGPSDAASVCTFTNGYLSELQVLEYVYILFDEYTRQFLIPKLNTALLQLQGGADSIESIGGLKEAISKVELAINNVSKEKSIKIQFKETIKRIKDLKTGIIEQPGFSWGLPSLDEKTIGILHGINIVAATKGGGKSSMLINIIVHNVLKLRQPLLFFSLEMPAIEVLTNVIANVKRINSRALRTGSLDENELLSLEEIENRLDESFVIDETGGITWEYFEVKVKSFRTKNKIPYNKPILVLLDYLGLMKNSVSEARMSKEEKIEQICNELMRICKNENIALVKLAQFSRESDRRGNDKFNVKTINDELKAFRPRMSDLKGSAAIESNAVTILLLYRPEYYGITEANGKDLRGICEINVAKGRYVNPGPLYVKFNGKYNLFEDYVEENAIKTSDIDAF